jgi:hypothetical protein
MRDEDRHLELQKDLMEEWWTWYGKQRAKPWVMIYVNFNCLFVYSSAICWTICKASCTICVWCNNIWLVFMIGICLRIICDEFEWCCICVCKCWIGYVLRSPFCIIWISLIFSMP